MPKIQAICSAGVVTTFDDTSLKAFNKKVEQYSCIVDTNGWSVNTKHIISWVELPDPEE